MTSPLVSPPHVRLGGRRLAALTVVAGLVAVACGNPGPTATPSASATPGPPTATPSGSPSPAGTPDPSFGAIYDQVEREVLAMRGLEALKEIEPQILDEDGIRAYIEQSFEEEYPDDLIAAEERMLKALGLLEEDVSLEETLIELQSSQVAGLYSPEDDRLYVVSKSGEIGPVEKSTYAHEFTHLLQDQNFDLDAMDFDEVGQSDRAIARLALVEGDATLLMSLWQLRHLTQEELFELISGSLDPEAQAVLNEMPPFLRDSLLFPYTGGLVFVQALFGTDDWGAIDAAYDDLPASTEQILHPEKYRSGELPVAVELPADLAATMGAGWTLAHQDVLGEFQLATWLGERAGDADEDEAAEGWGGDRMGLLHGPADAWALVIRTSWDSAADASEFQAAAGVAVGDGPYPGTVVIDGRDVTVVVASDGSGLDAAVAASRAG